MEFRLGTPVLTHDGHRLGTVDRLVLRDPAAPADALVVHKGGLIAHDILVDRRHVASVDADGVHLKLDHGAASQLPKFEEEEYTLPATTPEEFPLGALMYPAGYDPAAVPYIVGEETNLQLGGQDIARGYSVVSSDGELGVVEDLLADGTTGQLHSVLVQTHGPRGVVQVPTSEIERIEGETVTLRGSSQAFLAERPEG
jgi:sporulation protein YlmC with PRC-barrel domain